MIRQWPLIGRSEELAVIADATRPAADSARGIVLSGAAGVGKTRVAREALAGCGRRGVRRHWIVGTASARNVPLGAFADIVSDFGPDPLRRVREVIDGLVATANDNEVVVGVDDAHHLDDLSAFTVHQLVTRRLATVILTIRSREPAPDAVTALWKDHHLQRLELQPLSLPETTTLLEEVLGGAVQSLSARRLWQYTQGNTLYLRHLIDSEVAAQRIARHAGVWLWDGHPALSPTLAELIEARIARVPKPVQDVLDALSVAEPLDARVLAAITDPEALAEAESLGLVVVTPGEEVAAVRLAHPMLGEVRRTGSLRLQRLSGRIAAELGRSNGADPRALVHRAMLTIESDLAADSELFVAAAAAAMELLDARLALNLAERAVLAGGGPEASLTLAMANFWLERPADAEAILADLARRTSGPLRTQVATLRISNLAGEMGRVADAERELDALPTDDADSAAVAHAFRALIDIVRGHSAAAVDRAATVLARPPADAFAHMHAIYVLVAGYGDLGRVDDVGSAMERGHRLLDSSAGISHARFQLALLQSNAYRSAGALTLADTAIDRIRQETLDVPFEESWHSLLTGLSAMTRGSLTEARRALQETLAYLGAGDSGRVIAGFGRSWLTTVNAMAGRAADARREFETIRWWAHDVDACVWDAERSIAQAWMYAAEGAISQAVSLIRDAAALESVRGRPAWEVLLLQTATQFGDATTAPRLAVLAGVVQGPRAPAAAAHAAALAAADGDALLDSSRRYHDFGDRLAAADAAAQAVIAYRRAGLRGAAMSAAARAGRLAAECPEARTPALRAATTRQPFTVRQLEIIMLAAQGLSNKQIADRLTVSIRSVEGHLFRASQRVGANGREQLVSIVQRF